MRVLFHADLNHGQAAAVWRCRDLLKTQYGIELFDNCGDPDVLLLHTQKPGWEGFLQHSALPAVVLERIDGAQLTGDVRNHLARPNLKAVVKNTIYADPNEYNGPWWRGHELSCRTAMGDPAAAQAPHTPAIPVTPELYGKLKLGFSFTAYPHYDKIRNLEPYDLSQPRPYTCHFAGTTDYGAELPWLNWHRQAAVRELQNPKLAAFVSDRRSMQFPEYFKTLLQSEFVVSPWGLGETCYRDFEAVLCGCLLIKPATQHVLCMPRDFYNIPPVKRYVCKPDFSDLADIVANAERVQIGDRIHWARWLNDSNSTPAIARRFAGIFKEAAG